MGYKYNSRKVYTGREVILNDKKGAEHLALSLGNGVLWRYDLNELPPHSGLVHHADLGCEPEENCQQKP